MKIINFLKGAQEDCPYSNILLTKSDYDNVRKVWDDTFRKLYSIAEYELAMQLSKKRITQSEFDGAMLYWKKLISYFQK